MGLPQPGALRSRAAPRLLRGRDRAGRMTDADGSAVALDHDEVPAGPTRRWKRSAGCPTVNGSATVTAGNAPDLSSGAAMLVLPRRTPPAARRWPGSSAGPRPPVTRSASPPCPQ